MLSLSIIVPATGRQTELDDTLVSVLENRPKNCEILVPHTQAYQDPYDLDDEVRFVLAASDAVVDLYNAGIRASQADLVHLLGSGRKVSSGWTDSPRRRFETDPHLAAVSPRLRMPDSRRSTIGVQYRCGGSRRAIKDSSSGSLDGPCLQAAFFRHAALMSLGGLDGSLCEYYAEVDLAARMRQLQLKCIHDPESDVIGRATKRPSGFRAAREMEWVFWRYAGDNGRMTSVVAHLLTIAGHALPQMTSPQIVTAAAGHLVGMAECLLRISELMATVSSPPAGQVDQASTIRLRSPDDPTNADERKFTANRRGA